MYRELAEARKRTHTEIIGSTGSGKSKLLQYLMQEDVRDCRGFILIDRHGDLYCQLKAFLALLGVRRNVYLLNLSDPDLYVGFNPFSTPYADIATATSRGVNIVSKVWGMKNTNEAPTFERVCGLVIRAARLADVPFEIAAALLNEGNGLLRRNVLARTDAETREQWEFLTSKKGRAWDEATLSTANRLNRFVGQTSIRRVMGRTKGNISIDQILAENGILLVHLGSSLNLDLTGARTFGALLLSEIFEAAMRRASTEPFTVYCDEFQDFVTDDLAAMLDQIRKRHVSLCLSHQRMAQLMQDPQLMEAVLTNCKARFVMGGVPFSVAQMFAQEMLLPEINKRQVKAQIFATKQVSVEETRKSFTTTETEGESEGEHDESSFGFGSNSLLGQLSGHSAGEKEGSDRESSGESQLSGDSSVSSHGSGTSRQRFTSRGKSETTSPFLTPVTFKELSSESDWSRDEKVSKCAELMMHQPQRCAFLQLPDKETRQIVVPFLEDPDLSDKTILSYELAVLSGKALEGVEIDRQIAEQVAELRGNGKALEGDFVVRRTLTDSPELVG